MEITIKLKFNKQLLQQLSIVLVILQILNEILKMTN